MTFLDEIIPTTVLTYKCYTATYFINSHKLFVWKTDYKTDNAFLVLNKELENEPNEEELIKYIRLCIKNKKTKKKLEGKE